MPSSVNTSCSPGVKKLLPTFAPFKISATASNSSGFDRCVRSPVCSRKAGASGRALSLSTAILSVPATSWFGALLKPMWLSLIWTKVKSPVAAPAPAALLPLSNRDARTPPPRVKATPAPTQAMHLSIPRRSMPSLWGSCVMRSFIVSLLSGIGVT